MFLKVVNMLLFIQIRDSIYYVIRYYVSRSKNKLIVELSELRVDMVDMERAGFGILVLFTQFQWDLLSASAGQKKEVGSSETTVHIHQSRWRCFSEGKSCH